MTRQCLTVFASMLIASAHAHDAQAQDARVQTVLRAFENAKPTEKSLTFYTLDWATNLAEAKERARKESRPIFLLINTNITAGTSFYQGHT